MKVLAFSLVFLLLVFPLASAYPLTLSGKVGSKYEWMYTVSVLVPAVSNVNGAFRGVVSELDVTVAWPGSGTVYFAADPLTEVDTQASARMAVLVASILAGVDYHSYDYFIHLKAPAPIVGGPSASGAMAVAVLAALHGHSVRRDFSMTGMVEPDAVLGPVGGIPEKLEAVADRGVKVFVIPLGQEYAVDLNTGRMVDTVSLGRQLGVKVKPLPTILDAYAEATGDKSLLNIALNSSIPGYPHKLVVILKTATSRFERYAESNLTCWERYSRGLSPEWRSTLARFAAEANTSLHLAGENLENSFYYSAASYAFRAAIDATYACLAAKILSTEKPLELLVNETRKLLGTAEENIVKANETLTRLLHGRLSDALLQLSLTAISRIRDAAAILEDLNARLASGVTPTNALETLYEAVYLYYRSLTALQWANTAKKLSGEGVGVSWSRLKETLSAYLYFAKTEAEYLNALGLPATQYIERLETAYQRLEHAKPYALLETLSEALNTISTLTLALHKAFSTDVKASITAAERSLQLLLGLTASRYNVTPIMPLLYYEYAVSSTDTDARLTLLVEASSYATLLASLAAKPAKPPHYTPPKPKTVTVTESVTTTRTVTRTETITHSYTTTTTIKVTSTATVTKTVGSTSTVTATVTRQARTAGNTAVYIAASLIAGVAVGYILSASRKR